MVPVGLSKYREGLYPLEPFEKEDAKAVLEMIHRFQKECFEKYGCHFIHASDEWYVLAGEELPEEERYDGYLQLENGVGMLRLLLDEFHDAIGQAASDTMGKTDGQTRKRHISMVTGLLAYPYIQHMCDEVMEHFPQLDIHLYGIRNDFFGEHITVSGLLTGQDILAQLQGRELGERVYLPQNVLRSGETVFLDDLTVADLEETLQVPIYIVKSSGYDFLKAVLEVTEQEI